MRKHCEGQEEKEILFTNFHHTGFSALRKTIECFPFSFPAPREIQPIGDKRKGSIQYCKHSNRAKEPKVKAEPQTFWLTIKVNESCFIKITDHTSLEVLT